MPRIIFWNVNKKNLTNLVCSVTSSTDADVVVLLESSVLPTDMLSALKRNVSPEFYYPLVISGSNPRFHCFCKNPRYDLAEIDYDFRTSTRTFQIGQHKTLLVLVHGIDIRNNDAHTRQSNLQALVSQMKFLQKDKKISKLIFLGDFNMNPFEPGMNEARGLNAMMTKTCVVDGQRKFQDVLFDFYYNPMWSLFGDNTDGPAGTIYFTGNQGHYGWSMLDQVIVHHSVVDLFQDVKILTEAGTESLMNRKGRPDKKKASDHFPLLVNFNEGE